MRRTPAVTVDNGELRRGFDRVTTMCPHVDTSALMKLALKLRYARIDMTDMYRPKLFSNMCVTPWVETIAPVPIARDCYFMSDSATAVPSTEYK